MLIAADTTIPQSIILYTIFLNIVLNKLIVPNANILNNFYYKKLF